MINHARTLLLNRDGSKRPGYGYYLEEYIDPTFKPVKLSTGLDEFHRMIIEEGSDNAYANFRVHQCMKVLHSTEFVAYVKDLDPRITYDKPVNVSRTDISIVGNSLTQTVPADINGSLTLTSDVSRLYNSWLIAATDTNTLTFMHAQTGFTFVTVLSVIDWISQTVTLKPQPNLSVVFKNSVPAGAEWVVNTFLEPPDDLVDLTSKLTNLSGTALVDLFPNREPYKTFHSLYLYADVLQYKLSGALLAFIYRANEIYNG